MDHERIYGALLHLYPRRFRNEWDTELRQAFRDQLVHPIRPTNHPVARAWLATTRDLVTSLPRQRTEQLMRNTSPFSRRLAVTLPAIAIVAVGATVSARLFLLFPAIVIGVVLFLVRRRMPLSEVFATGLRWYELAGAGLGVLATIGILAAILPDYTGAPAELLWLGAFVSFLLGWSLIILGALSALSSLWRRFRPARPAA